MQLFLFIHACTLFTLSIVRLAAIWTGASLFLSNSAFFSFLLLLLLVDVEVA